MRDQEAKLTELDIKVKIITFDSDFLAKAYAKSAKLVWPLLLDNENEKAYAAYGMQRASWWTLYNPLSILTYIWIMLSGTRPGKPGKDFNQLGGDILVDPQGIVRMHYMSESPHDRPSIDSIFETVEKQKVSS